MKFNLAKPVLDLDGNQVQRTEAEVLTMEYAVRDALTRPPQQPISPDESIRRYQLQTKVFEVGDVELDASEIVLIQHCLAQAYGPLVLGQIAAVLKEPVTSSSKAKAD
ncbi:hypothetical protein AAG593_09785 [Citromicrobium bathyomarinum]